MSARHLPEATFARTRLGSGPGLALAHGAGSSIAGTYGPILEGVPTGCHAAQRRVQVAHAVGGGIAGVVGEDVEQETADELAPGPPGQ